MSRVAVAVAMCSATAIWLADCPDILRTCATLTIVAAAGVWFGCNFGRR